MKYQVNSNTLFPICQVHFLKCLGEESVTSFYQMFQTKSTEEKPIFLTISTVSVLSNCISNFFFVKSKLHYLFY